MQEHHGYIANLLLAAVVSTIPLWVQVLEETSWFSGKIVPIIGVIVGCLQLWFLIKKFMRRH